MRKTLWSLLAAGVTTLAMASSAMAAAPTGNYTPFTYCPYSNPDVQSCFNSATTSGSFTLGNASVPINRLITLQGGYSVDFDSGATTWYNAVGAPTLSRTPLDVPGGLLGLMNPGGFFGILEQAFENAVRSANGVTATAELVGPVQFNYVNFLTTQGPAIVLPLRIHLENPFLGPNCYIGSTSRPVTLRLTDGTTSPPAPNTPITGSPGTIVTSTPDNITTATGDKLVDNAFSVPAASDCGYLPLDKLLITAAVNSREGLPAAAGKNTAILQGTTKLASTYDVQASVH